MYIGETTAARPIAKPPTTRQNIKSAIPIGSPVPMPAIRKRAAATSITRRRPNRWASLPPTKAPTAEPSSAIETTKPWMKPSVMLNSAKTALLAPLMTELS